MVSQLLVASRLEAGAFTPQQEVFAVPPLIERTWEALRADRPFELVVEGAAHLAVADPDRLEQVLWALFDNAVKYSPAGSPIDVRIAPVGDQLAITVRDQRRRHGRRHSARRPSSSSIGPTGLASSRRMAAVSGCMPPRGLMEAMGGSIGDREPNRRGNGHHAPNPRRAEGRHRRLSTNVRVWSGPDCSTLQGDLQGVPHRLRPIPR